MTIHNKYRAQVKNLTCAFAISTVAAGVGAVITLPAGAQTTTPGDTMPLAGGLTPPNTGAPPVGLNPVPATTGPGAAIPSVSVPAGNASPTAPQSNAPTGSIASITVSGNANITKDAILAVISEKVGSPYDPAAAAKDQDAIKGMGYFNGDIGLNATRDPLGGVDVTFTVQENPIIKKIVFTANTPNGVPTIAPDLLKSKMKSQEGQVLNVNTLEHDLYFLFDRETGYVRAQGFVFDVSSDINIDPNTQVLTIPLVEAHIGAIEVTGLKKTKLLVVTRELHSVVGDVLDEKKLQKDLTKIYNLGLFEQVGPFKELPTEVGKVTISIPVVEKRSGQVSVGVGYSSTAKLVGRAELAENNFRGLGERVSVQWEVGGVSSESSLDVGFFEPYLDSKHTSLSVDAYDKAIYRFSSSTFGTSDSVGDNNTYIEKRRGATIGLARPLTEFFTASVSLRSEKVSANNVELPPDSQFLRQIGPVSSLAFGGTYDTRDNAFSPASGGLNSVTMEVGTSSTSTINNAPGALKPGQHNFTKLGFDLRRYMSLQGPRKPGDYSSPKRVLAVRLLVGMTNRDTPFFEQYFLGGADSLRGTDTDRFWGSKMALVQAELRLPVGKENFQGVLFTDVGDAWDGIYQDPQLRQHDKLSLQSDFGIGVRIVTPIGPIRLDYAFGQGGGKTQFSIGPTF